MALEFEPVDLPPSSTPDQWELHWATMSTGNPDDDPDTARREFEEFIARPHEVLHSELRLEGSPSAWTLTTLLPTHNDFTVEGKITSIPVFVHPVLKKLVLLLLKEV